MEEQKRRPPEWEAVFAEARGAKRNAQLYASVMEESRDNSTPTPEQTGIVEDASLADGSIVPERPALPKRRIGFMAGKYTVPDDIDTPFAAEIEELFYGHRAQHKFDDVERAAAERLRREQKAGS
jgi:hypothetical protein